MIWVISPKNDGCPTLAAFLFLRLGWETLSLYQSC
jgi:hypothetical protein